MNPPIADIERRRDAAVARVRPVRMEDCRRYARLPRRGKTLAQCFATAGQTGVIGVLPAAADAPRAVESARAWLNAGADALCFPGESSLPLARRMECVWAVSDFLEAHGRETPLWLREGLFHPAQLAEALEAGVQTLSIYPGVMDEAALSALVAAAHAAKVECVWEIFNAQDAVSAQSLGAPWTCVEMLAARATRAGALALGAPKIISGLSPENVEEAPGGFRALTWEALPEDEEDAQRLLASLRSALPPCGADARGARARASASTGAQSAKRPRRK